jgi:hypothetical protein
MSPRKLLFAALAFGLLSAGPVQAGFACFPTDTVKAAQLRHMQQEFTVAAISCLAPRTQEAVLAEPYNQFVGKFGAILAKNAFLLRAHFSHHGGPAGFDSWMTSLANSAAQRSLSEPDYCQRNWYGIERALAVEPAALADFAASYVPDSSLVRACDARRETPGS